jgi:hypothetical protein
VALAKRNKGGRPPTGRDPVRTMRLADEFLDKIDHWASQQEDQPGRSEAIRRLVELGLTVRRLKAKQAPVQRARRAKQLAAQAIDKMGDPTLHPDEHAQRRRRLTKGPEEFREVRVDRPKAKGK